MKIGSCLSKTKPKVLALIVASIVVAASGALIWSALPSCQFEEVRRSYVPSDAWFLARHGEPLESI